MQNFTSLVNGLGQDFWAIGRALFPPVCIFCGGILTPESDPSASYFTESLQICRKCMTIIPFRMPHDMLMAGLSNPFDNDPIPDFSLIVPFYYEEPIVGALRALKFHDAPYLGDPLAFFMWQAVLTMKLTFDVVIPIPLGPKRLRKRGYNQALLLAQPTADRLAIPCLPSFLVRTRDTSQQSRFTDPNLRRANISGAFFVPQECDISGLRILLVDDVVTTGNTVHEAAAELYSRGASFCMGLAVSSRRR